MKAEQKTQFEQTCASLDYVANAARHRLEPLGISVADTSHRVSPDWSTPVASWSVDYSRTVVVPPYTARSSARILFALSAQDGVTPEWEATWRSETWAGSSPNLHTAQGAAKIGPEVLTYGSYERLVLALLRRAAKSLPEVLDDALEPPWPELPGEVDHLVEVKAFHKTMIEPWTGPPIGCSASQITALESRIGRPLPLAYKQYLGFMGADHRGVFIGSDWFIEHAQLNVIDAALAYMDVDYTPSGDTLTFMSHQGYIHGWMDLPCASDDPSVHFYNESADDKQVNIHLRFTDLLLAELRHMSYFTRRVRARIMPED